jgi:hypothetical protein
MLAFFEKDVEKGFRRKTQKCILRFDQLKLDTVWYIAPVDAQAAISLLLKKKYASTKHTTI